MLNDLTSFVPYNSFEQGEQEHGKFLEGGLARGLVHTSNKKADILSSIANNKEYPSQVNVRGFNSVTKPILRVVGLDSNGFLDGRRLDVVGYVWNDYGSGFALGGLVSDEAGEKKLVRFINDYLSMFRS